MGFFSSVRDLVLGPPAPGPEEARILRAIAFDPENVALYREYGEWLKKNGDPEWGEFVLVDIYLEPLDRYDPRRKGHDERWSDLYTRLPKRRFAPLARLGLRPMVSSSMCVPAMWLKHGVISEVAIDRPGILPERVDQLFRAAPGLQKLKLTGSRVGFGGFVDYKPDIDRIMALPQLEQISQLEFVTGALHHDALATLAATVGLRNIRVLQVDSIKMPPPPPDPPGPRKPKPPVSAQDLPVLMGSSNLRKLRELHMQFCTFSDEALLALVRNPQVTELRVLKAGGGLVTSNSVLQLAATPKVKRLQILMLPGAQLFDDGVRALADSPHLRELTELVLNKAQIDADGAAALAGSPNLAKVVNLELAENLIGSAGAAALATSPHLRQLRKLHLSHNDIGPDGAVALAASPNLQNVEELDLGNNPIEDHGAIALANSLHLTKLRELAVNECKLTSAGLAAILRAPWITQIKSLRLGYNPLEEAGARLLIAATNLSGLESLTLWNIGDLADSTKQALQDRFGTVVSL